MIGKEYNSPVLKVLTIGQTDVITTSNYEGKDVMKDDSGMWDD